MTPALVVGLLPAQAARVQRALGHRYRFRFVTARAALAVRQTSAVNAVMVGYVDHGVTWRLKRLVQPGQTLHFVHGLEKNLITLLESS